MSVDSLLELLGKRNIVVFFWYTAINFIKSASSCASMLTFLWAHAKPTSIHCKLPTGHSINDSVPYESVNGKLIPSQCLQYRNFSESTNETEPCQLGYEYESYVDTSIVMEWNLVCDKKYIAAMVDSAFFIPSIFASSVFTALGDHFGRRPVFVVCLLSLSIIGFLSSFSPNPYVYAAFRLIMGPLQHGTYTLGFCYCLELFPVTRRSITAISSEIFWVISSCILCLIVYFVRSWKLYIYVTTLPFFLGIILLCVMPESIPWLFAKGRTDDAYKTLNKMTVFMKDRDNIIRRMELMRNEELECNTEKHKTTDEIYPFYFVCTRKHIQKWSMINMFTWSTMGIAYYSFSIFGTTFGNVYLNFFLLSLIETPAVFASTYLGMKLGRKVIVSSCFSCMGIFFLTLSFGIHYWASYEVINMIFVIIGRFFAGIGFNIIFVHASEMYPTSLRSMGVAVGSSSSRFGIAIAPFILTLKDIFNFFPTIIVVVMCFIAAVIYTLPPETRLWELPQTLSDVYYFRKNPKYQMKFFGCVASQRTDDIETEEAIQFKPIQSTTMENTTLHGQCDYGNDNHS